MGDTLELGKKRAAALGIESYGIMQINPLSANRYYSAEHIHKLLGEGVEQFAYKHDKEHMWFGAHDKDGIRNLKALLIGIRPIVQESEERKLLKEIVKYNTCIITGTPVFPSSEWIERAKRLLDGEK